MQQNQTLMHYGVKGMKWGVRRYRNYEGSYTKRGVERYDKAEAAYNAAKQKQKSVKASVKAGSASKQDYQNAKSQTKAAKRKLDTAYGNLKSDKMADQGKKLYASGKTITGNTRTNVIAQTGVVVGSRVVNRMIASKYGNQQLANLSASAIAAGGTAVNVLLALKTHSDNKKLRAYYGHGRRGYE